MSSIQLRPRSRASKRRFQRILAQVRMPEHVLAGDTEEEDVDIEENDSFDAAAAGAHSSSDNDDDDDDDEDYVDRKPPSRKRRRKGDAGDPTTEGAAVDPPGAVAEQVEEVEEEEEEEEPTIPSLPADCLMHIMEFASADCFYAMAHSYRDVYKKLPHEAVIRCAVLAFDREKEVTFESDYYAGTRGASFRDPEWRHYMDTTRRSRMSDIMVGVKSGLIVMPSPQRLLSLVFGKTCEMPGCSSTLERTYVGEVSLSTGIFACRTCRRGWVHSHCDVTPTYREHLDQLPAQRGYWRAPYYTPTNQRVGPAITMMDGDRIVRNQTTKAEVMKIVDLDLQKRIVDWYDKAEKKIKDYDKAREVCFNKKIRARRDRKRDQIADYLQSKYGNAPWLPIALERGDDGYFTNPLMKNSIEEFIDRTFYLNEIFHKGTVTRKARMLADAFQILFSKGVHDASFVDKHSTSAVAQFWRSKWKAELDENSKFILDRLRYINDIKALRKLDDCAATIAKLIFSTCTPQVEMVRAMLRDDEAYTRNVDMYRFSNDANAAWRDIQLDEKNNGGFFAKCDLLHQKLLSDCAEQSTGADSDD